MKIACVRRDADMDSYNITECGAAAAAAMAELRERGSCRFNPNHLRGGSASVAVPRAYAVRFANEFAARFGRRPPVGHRDAVVATVTTGAEKPCT